MTPLVYTQSTYNPPAIVNAPASFGLQKTTYGAPSQWEQQQQQQLVEAVRKQYQREASLVEKENEKISKITGTSVFSKYRLQKHENAAIKHRHNAKRHEDWLRAYTAPSKPAL